MTKEQIEQIATDYIEDLLSDNIDYGSVNNEEDNYEAGRVHALDEFGADIFKAGAQWRINSVWHDNTILPKLGEYIVVQMKDEVLVAKLVSKEMRLIYFSRSISATPFCNITRWAYAFDLLPQKHD